MIDHDVRSVRVRCDVCKEVYVELELPIGTGGWSTDHAVRGLGWRVPVPGWHVCLRCGHERWPGGLLTPERIADRSEAPS